MTEWRFPFSRSTDNHVDLTSFDAYNNGAPDATFERMRREAPVSWTQEKDGKGFWSITRHADIRELNKDTSTLSSARGIRMEDQSAEEYEARRTFQETDPPEHTEFRMLFNAAFSRVSVGKFEGSIRKITAELIGKGLAMGDLDATDAIARQLPMRILGQILGLPESDGDWLVEKGDALISNSDPDYTDFVVDKVDTNEYRFLPFRSPAALELFDYANDILKEIRKGKDYGVLNMITQPTKDGRVITDGEFRNFFCLAVAAGNDTTRYSIAASLQALANQPQLLEYMRGADKAKILKATDEMVRWASPTTHFRRTATKDFEYGGKQIKEGDKVILWFVSGNRDHDAFDEPYEVKLDRQPNRHIGFGQGGPHVCLGMFLAKMEVGIMLEEVGNSVETLEQTAEHEFLRSNFILGIKKLPLRMTPRR
jgi:cytochrome P450